MKIICTQENLSRGLQLVSHIASKNISLPILNNVLLKAERGVLKLMTTNLETGVVCRIRGKVEKEGAFTVLAKTLNDYVNLLTKQNINIEVVDQNLKITSANSKTLMKGMEASEFPLIPEVETAETYEVKTRVLKEALSAVSYAVSYDETRPEINGVYFKFSNDWLTLAATDSYRLAETKVKLERKTKDHDIIVPIKTIQELARIVSEEEGAIKISSNENQILFSLGEVKLTSRLVEGQYPDYRQIVPQEHKTHIVVNTNEFINTVKRASLFCKPGSNDIKLKFSPASNEIVVSATNIQIGESETRQPAKIEGGENDIVFNHRFLLDGLQNIKTEECELEINTNANPGLLKQKQEGNYLYIIMPIKQ